MKQICVYGGAAKDAAAVYTDGAYEVGRAIASSGAGLVYGGGATGCMGAVGRGVRDHGGEVISVLPRFMTSYETLLKPVTRTIVTETMSERKHEMEALADAFIVLPGGIGTLDEFFETLTLRSLDRFDKPIVLYNGGGYFDSMVAMLQDQVQRGFVKERILTLFDVADTPEEAVRRALGA
ncbi:MAG: TIGR00730 family Rossman fold protein [Lachnospiraceae bacterium]|nr:TIGR00730 family Rossman fold protein [Lachnospiraceae bacterium]